MKSLQNGVVLAFSGPSKPLFQETCPKTHFFPFQSLHIYICKQVAKSSMNSPVGEHWALTVRAGNLEPSARESPRETLTLHYSIVKRLQGPIPLLLPLPCLCWNPWHHTTRRPAPNPARQISESWANSLRQGGSGETVFLTTVGTLQLIILFQSKHNINLSVFFPILWKEICIGNYLSDVNICKHHSHLLVHMKRKNIIKVPAI